MYLNSTSRSLFNWKSLVCLFAIISWDWNQHWLHCGLKCAFLYLQLESMGKDPLTLSCFWQSQLQLERKLFRYGSSLFQPFSLILCCLCQAQGVGVFLPAADAPGPGPKDGGLVVLVDDSPQKRLLAQKATPPPSPLLSELLKKGNLISASPRLVRASLAWIITSKTTWISGVQNDINAYETNSRSYCKIRIDIILNCFFDSVSKSHSSAGLKPHF